MIERVWPDVNMSRTLASMVQSDQGGGFGEVELKIGTVYDPAAMAWDFLVIYPGDEAVIVERRLKSNPWIIFSSDSAPGEPLGRGPVLDVLPDIKTADKIVELLLKHQSIAVHGMWQADDDGILNPYDVKFRPGAIFPKAVGSAGLRRLEAPGDFRDAVALLAELRQRARYMIFGPELPPMDSRAMTATEVEQRRQEANLIRAPENLRVWMRLVVPLVKWAVSVLARRGEMPFLPVHNGRLLKSMPSSPLVRMQKMGIVVDGLNAYQLAASIGPEGAAQAADPARVSRWVLEMAGFPADLLNDDAQIASQQQQAQMAAALQQGSEILKNVGQSGLVDGRPAAAAPTLATLFGAGQ